MSRRKARSDKRSQDTRDIPQNNNSTRFNMCIFFITIMVVFLFIYELIFNKDAKIPDVINSIISFTLGFMFKSLKEKA